MVAFAPCGVRADLGGSAAKQRGSNGTQRLHPLLMCQCVISYGSDVEVAGTGVGDVYSDRAAGNTRLAYVPVVGPRPGKDDQSLKVGILL